jgi:hypothetical protein
MAGEDKKPSKYRPFAQKLGLLLMQLSVVTDKCGLAPQDHLAYLRASWIR